MQETNLIEQEQPVGVLTAQVPVPAPTMTLCSYGAKLTREELARVATPVGTATHKPIPHIAVVEKLIEALGFRQIGIVQEEYAVSADGMRMFGVMDLSSGFQGCRFAIGLRNSHDKSFRLSCTVGLRIFVCENLAFHGEYTPVLAKHSKHFSLEDSLAIGVDRMQRNFGPLKQQVEEWQALQLSTASAKLLIYQAFIEEESGFPKHLARRVHDLYFQPAILLRSRYRAGRVGFCKNAPKAAPSLCVQGWPSRDHRGTAELSAFRPNGSVSCATRGNGTFIRNRVLQRS